MDTYHVGTQVTPEHKNADSPTVSIVLCTYNGERFLNRQLDTLLRQTYPFHELLISDDCSTDQTVSIIREFAGRDPRIKLHINKTRLGPNKNFEQAFLRATGDRIAPCDQDDIWDTRKIEVMMHDWPRHCSFIYSLPGSVNENGTELKNAPPVFYSDIDSIYPLVFNTPINGHASMFHKSLLDICLPLPTDIYWDWWISMHAASTGTIGCIRQTLSWQRIHGSNYSRDIHGLTNKKERDEKKRKQWSYFLQSFLSKQIAKEDERKELLEYAHLLDKLDGNHFSKPMYRFVMKHRKQVFHYKKKPFVFFSHLKHAFRMAKSGVL